MEYHCNILKCVSKNNFYYERNHSKTDIYRKKKNFLNIRNILKNIFKILLYLILSNLSN